MNYQQAKKSNSGVSNAFSLVIIILTVFVIIMYALDNNKSNESEKKQDPAPQTREEKIKEHFSSWDGSHRGLTKVIKKAMNDPDSYDHVETVYWDKGDYLIVRTTFRGKNVFGGVVKNWVKAKVDLKGHVLGVISQGP